MEVVCRWNKHDNALACKLFKEATVLDPEYRPAYELWGWTYYKFMPSNGFLLTTSMLKNMKIIAVCPFGFEFDI